MTKTKTYKSDVSASLHKLASDLHEIGMIDDAIMRSIDRAHLSQISDAIPKASNLDKK